VLVVRQLEVRGSIVCRKWLRHFLLLNQTPYLKLNYSLVVKEPLLTVRVSVRTSNLQPRTSSLVPQN